MTPSVRARLDRLRRQYAPHEHRPLDGYAATMTAFGVLAGSLGVAAKITGRTVPERPALADVVLISIATHKLSRLIAKDAVTSPLRAPFTRYAEPGGSAEVNEEVRDQGSPVRHSIGELISCPFCLAVWVATGLTSGLVFVPRFTRLAATVFTATAASDFLQMAYSLAKEAAEGGPAESADEERLGQPAGGRVTARA
ncbi:DUF1360 domain-containing protein [Couchioplanes azureus]|uniref:DUF1360 domain-containing protein n=1 Tax=Couchioplanes caeruleus TaxID=56438 RepID=UPI00167075BE|nr:DUF1360 domain-containing protein [Couchioplanes caeruleus]GGQ78023.1 hypothetical protein GCM10010166_55080 [Couchioplanes caeruleus subsp. azureus]